MKFGPKEIKELNQYFAKAGRNADRNRQFLTTKS